jgi:hypothetical protein
MPDEEEIPNPSDVGELDVNPPGLHRLGNEGILLFEVNHVS